MNASIKVTVELTAVVTMNESEIMALDGILGYNVDTFLKVFYEKMGEAYVKPYEKGVRSLHTNLKGKVSTIKSEMEDARKRFAKL